MKQFANIHEAVEAYRHGEATLDDVSRAASRTIAADLQRAGREWEGFVPRVASAAPPEQR